MTDGRITDAAVAFIEQVRYADLPEEALRIGRRCILDSLGLYVAGTVEESVRVLVADAQDQGGRPDALLLGAGATRVPAPLAARVLGTSGHAHDWDDTQVSNDPNHVYGLLTHPSLPPLTAALAVAQRIGGVSGERFMLAFQTGFEVECKVSEWMDRDHYKRGHHSSATVGTFGACAAAAKLLGLTGGELAHAIGIAASLAAGIRCNFGTMTKPLHVGRASENGVVAALLAARGFTADPRALDGRWGFGRVLGGGYDDSKIAQGFGRIWSIVDPGVSIKPYPSGILTHQSMDAMLRLVTRHEVRPEQVERIEFYAGSNILEPIRYQVAADHLQAKFSMSALLSMIALYRKAGVREFTDEAVRSAEMQDMQRRVRTIADPEIERQGFEKIRSRIELETRDGRRLVEWADERYRGGPSYPMTDDEVAGKFADCAGGLLGEARCRQVVDAVWSIERMDGAEGLAAMIQTDLAAGHAGHGPLRVAGED